MNKMKQEIDYSWIRYINQRIKNNKNWLCIFTGPTGSGKSWSAISIANMLNPDFDICRLVFKGKKLMALINSGAYTKKGVVFIWDEAGVDLSNRNWQSVTNKVINYLLQTFRHRNFILIFTAPYADFIDISTKKLFHAEFQTVSINKTKKTVTVKPKQIQYNSNKGKFYYHYLRIRKPGTGIIKVKKWAIPKPPKNLIKEYETKKNAFTFTLNQEIEGVLSNLDVMGKRRKPLTDKQKEDSYYDAQNLTQREEAEKIGISQSAVSQRRKLRRNKGY